MIVILRNGSFSCKNTVEIFVGKDPEPFIMHRDVLIHYSDCFATVFRTCPGESERKSIVLKAEISEAFSIFAVWLYGQPIELDSELLLRDHGLEVFALAERLEVPKLGNALIDALIRQSIRSNDYDMSFQAICNIWNRVSPEGGLRTLLMDMLSNYGKISSSFIDGIPGTLFLLALVNCFLTKKKREAPWDLPQISETLICARYHKHSDGDDACKWASQGVAYLKSRIGS